MSQRNTDEERLHAERIKYLEKYIPVMTKKEQDEVINGRTDWPEETLIKWSGKLAERNAMMEDIRRKAYSKQPSLSKEQCKK